MTASCFAVAHRCDGDKQKQWTQPQENTTLQETVLAFNYKTASLVGQTTSNSITALEDKKTQE